MRRFRVIVLLLLALEVSAESRRRAVRSPSLPPLDPQTLQSVSFIEYEPVSLLPGSSHQFRLGILKCCVFYVPVPANVEWSVDPAFSHASIDSTGVLKIGENASNGTAYRVYARIDGKRIISRDVYVYTREENPLAAIGYFRQIGELPCDGSNRIDPVRGTAIHEMLMHADGSFSVTWIPFEVYKDYWGFFVARKNHMTLAIRYGNHLPDNFDGDGTWELVKSGTTQNGYDEYRLFLREIWLGSAYGQVTSAGCGVVLEGFL